MQGHVAEVRLGNQLAQLSVDLGLTDWYPGDGPKPARQGLYKVRMTTTRIDGAVTVYQRWAFFDIAHGWSWPQVGILAALRSRSAMASPYHRITGWCGLARDPQATHPPHGIHQGESP